MADVGWPGKDQTATPLWFVECFRSALRRVAFWRTGGIDESSSSMLPPPDSSPSRGPKLVYSYASTRNARTSTVIRIN